MKSILCIMCAILFICSCSKPSHEIELQSSTKWIAFVNADTLQGAGSRIFRVPENCRYCVTAYKTTDTGFLSLGLFLNQGGLSSGRTKIEGTIVYLKNIPITICKE